MTKEEFKELFINRSLNSKNNNMIVRDDETSLIEDIPKTTYVSFIGNNIESRDAHNVFIDFEKINVHDIFNYILSYLKRLNLLDNNLDYELPFNRKIDVFRFQRILSNYDIVVQIIINNVNLLNTKDQMLLNELYYYNSPFFNVITFTKDHFSTYQLQDGKMLDGREDYQMIEFEKAEQRILKDKYWN